MLKLNSEIVKFAVVGATGFVVDAGIVTLLFKGLNFDPNVSRLIAIAFAVLATILLNRYWTFSHARHGCVWYQSVTYLITQAIGLSLNYKIYEFLVSGGDIWYQWPVLAVGVGSVVAMFVTFSLSKWIVFKK